MVQGIRICLPVQGAWVQSLVQEDSTYCGATKAHVPQLLNPCSRACTLRLQSLRVTSSLCSAAREATAMRRPCTTMKNSPTSRQLHTTTKTHCGQKERNNFLKKSSSEASQPLSYPRDFLSPARWETQLGGLGAALGPSSVTWS